MPLLYRNAYEFSPVISWDAAKTPDFQAHRERRNSKGLFQPTLTLMAENRREQQFYRAARSSVYRFFPGR